MQYMLLVYGEERLWQRLTPEELSQLERARDQWTQDLVKSGHFRTRAALHPASTATTVRQHDGRIEILDGPFPGASEALGAWQLVECSNLDEALSIAARFPALRAGFSLEIRPVLPS